MNKVISALCILSLTTHVGFAQTKKSNAKSSDAATTKQGSNAGFTKTANGLEYKIVSNGTGTKKPAVGDYVKLHLMYKVDDSLLFSSRQVMNNEPAEIQIQAAAPGDVAEGFTYMVAGDSAIFHMYIDSLMKLPQFQLQPWMKPGTGQKIDFYAKLVEVKTKEEKQAEMAVALARQGTVDDSILQSYFKANNLKPLKTASGLYYIIDKQGSGAQAKMGDTVVANYTGKLMNGQKFDSNVDTSFHHTQPFEFPVGMHSVIAGWDEAFMLFKTGTKGTIFIPSALGYGAQGGGPIPANAVLIFDIELKGVKPVGSNNTGARPADAPAPKNAPKKKN